MKLGNWRTETLKIFNKIYLILPKLHLQYLVILIFPKTAGTGRVTQVFSHVLDLHAHTHTLTQYTLTHSLTFACSITHTHILTHTHPYSHTQTLERTHSHTRTHNHTLAYSLIHARTHIHSLTHTHIPTHTHILTHTHTHTHIHMQIKSPVHPITMHGLWRLNFYTPQSWCYWV